jgi:AmmeMemoRadiSam system protein B
MTAADRSEIRPSPIAGTWYPGRSGELRAEIARYLANVEHVDLPGDLIGLIVPHAGYVYSGQVAAHAFKLLEGKAFEVVVVISPVHRVYQGAYMVTSYGYYETPLGLIRVATDQVDALAEAIDLVRIQSDMEHSLEIQLPFLQYLLGDFALIPIMMGNQDWSACCTLADALSTLLRGKDALLVASTDLSHFHANAQAVQLDRRVVDRVNSFDPKGLSDDLKAQRCEACGGGPVVSVMLAAREMGGNCARVLRCANSGNVTGDFSQVVGYMAAALLTTG